jgi:hypothetical protein
MLAFSFIHYAGKRMLLAVVVVGLLAVVVMGFSTSLLGEYGSLSASTVVRGFGTEPQVVCKLAVIAC